MIVDMKITSEQSRLIHDENGVFGLADRPNNFVTRLNPIQNGK